MMTAGTTITTINFVLVFLGTEGMLLRVGVLVEDDVVDVVEELTEADEVLDAAVEASMRQNGEDPFDPD